MPADLAPIQMGIRAEKNVDDIFGVRRTGVRAMVKAMEILSMADDPFTQQEPRDQLFVVPRSSHESGDDFIADADFQRLLHGHVVLDRNAVCTVAAFQKEIMDWRRAGDSFAHFNFEPA